MPISDDEFESQPEDSPATNAERVLRFLASNADQAYRAVEVAEATGVAENSVHPVLTRLEDRGLVRHREPYWAVGDPEAVRDDPAFGSVLEALEEELEDASEWLERALEGN